MSALMASQAALFDLFGSAEVGKTLREIDGVVAQREAGHFADHRFSETGGALAAEGLTGGLDIHPYHCCRFRARHASMSLPTLSTSGDVAQFG